MYILRWKQPSLDLQKAAEIQVPVASTVQHPTGITFTGKGAANYGSVQQQNILRLLENFADSQAPVGPTVGQLWYDTVSKSLKVCSSTSPITWSNASGVVVSDTAPIPQLGMLWFQTMGQTSGILHIYNGLGRYGSTNSNTIGGWNQVWPQVQTIAGRDEYDTMREQLEQLAGQSTSSYGSGAIGRYLQDLTDFASLDNSLRNAWASRGSDEFTLLKKSGDTRIPRQALNNKTLFVLADSSSPNDNIVCGAVNGVITPGQNGTIFINGSSVSIPADALPSDLQFDFAYIMYSANNAGGFAAYRFVKFENGSWFVDPSNGSTWQQFTPVAGQYIIGTGSTHQEDINIYPGIKNIFVWGNAVEIINPAEANLKVETNSQDWDKLLAAFRYAISRLDVPGSVIDQISKMPFVRDGWQIPQTLSSLPASDIRQAPIERRANHWPSIIRQISEFQNTQSAVLSALPVRYTLKGIGSLNMRPEVAIESLTPTLTSVFTSGIGQLKLAVNFDSFEDRCRFLFSGGALQLEMSHVGGALAGDSNLRAAMSSNVSMARFTADKTLIFIGSAPYTPGSGATNIGLQNANNTGKVLFTKTVGQTTITATVFRPSSSERLELQVDVNAGGQLSGTTEFKISVIRDTSIYNGSLPVYTGPNSYDPSDLLVLQQIDVAPTIVQHPSSSVATDGQGASFTVSATGTAPLSYDWQYNQGGGWLSLGAANSPTLSFTAALAQSGNAYRVVVSNTAGAATSNAAVLTVNPAGVGPSITQQPAAATITIGEYATLSVNATGTAPLTYTWYSDGNAIASGQTVQVNPTATTTYNCVVSNAFGTATSNTITVTVNAAISNIVSITQVPSGSVTAGTTVSLNSQVTPGTGTGAISAPYTYDWQVSTNNGASWSPIQSEWASAVNGNASLSIQLSTSQNTYKIRVNVNSVVTSNEIILSVSEQTFAAQITQQPTSSTICSGSSVTFTVAATGTAPLSYQWQQADTNGFMNIAGATSPSYTTTPMQEQLNDYRCVVSNPYGTATSNSATVTINTPPSISQQPETATFQGFGSTVTWSVTAVGTAPLSYEWQQPQTPTTSPDVSTVWVPVIGASSNSLTEQINTEAIGIIHRRVRIYNQCGQVISNHAGLTQGSGTAPQITQQPTTQSVSDGGTLQFNATVTGTEPISYQWEFSEDNTTWSNVT